MKKNKKKEKERGKKLKEENRKDRVPREENSEKTDKISGRIWISIYKGCVADCRTMYFTFAVHKTMSGIQKMAWCGKININKMYAIEG